MNLPTPPNWMPSGSFKPVQLPDCPAISHLTCGTATSCNSPCSNRVYTTRPVRSADCTDGMRTRRKRNLLHLWGVLTQMLSSFANTTKPSTISCIRQQGHRPSALFWSHAMSSARLKPSMGTTDHRSSMYPTASGSSVSTTALLLVPPPTPVHILLLLLLLLQHTDRRAACVIPPRRQRSKKVCSSIFLTSIFKPRLFTRNGSPRCRGRTLLAFPPSMMT